MPIKRVIKFIPAKGVGKFIQFNHWIAALPEPEKSQAMMINNAKQLLVANKTETGDMITTKHTDHVEYYYSDSFSAAAGFVAMRSLRQTAKLFLLLIGNFGPPYRI